MTTPIALQTPLQIKSAIRTAASKTGVDFDYLLRTAERESGLKSQAKAKTSSATGLFQFIDQTWLSMVKKHGAKHGLNRFADAIERGATGRYEVADPKVKEEILAERFNPQTASLMAGELTRETAEHLGNRLGRTVNKGELYMAHFLGASGAARFIQAKEANPEALAAQSFGREAAANRSVFFEKSGRMRTLGEVYDRLTKLHGGGEAAAPEASRKAKEVSPLPVAAQQVGGAARTAISQYSGLGGFTSRLTPEIMMILTSLDLPFGDR